MRRVVACILLSLCACEQHAKPLPVLREPTVSVEEPRGAPTEVSAPSAAADSMPPAQVPSTDVPAAVQSTRPSVSVEPLPNVTVRNIGIHIGGGPNDDETKSPIRESVRPHFDTLRRCWRLVEDPSRGGDFGVDLAIPAEGGRATVRVPRSSLRGPGFQECVLGVFEQIEFRKPRGGKTVVSYSIRFAPQ